MKRTVLRAAGVLLAVLFVISARTVLAARSELAMGNEVLAQGDSDGALIHWRRAAKWHVPTSIYSGDALTRMEELATARENGGDLSGSLRAWRSIRAAIFGARSFYIPHEDLRERADEKIAALSQGESTVMLSLLGRDSAPKAPFYLALLGFFAFWLGVLLAAARAIDEEDRILPGPARRYGALALCGFVLMSVALAL
ncbi:MAG: hypothetical protein ACI9KE_002967 [Polyangiales bacterium]|jgi:hypothetical protein